MIFIISIFFKKDKKGKLPYRSYSLGQCKFWHHLEVFRVAALLSRYQELLKNNTTNSKLFKHLSAKQSWKIEIDKA